MEAARATWTVTRLDDLNDRVKGMDTKMDAGFARLDERIDKLQHTLVQAMVALISIIAVLLIAFLGLVATHL
jgi:1,4-dihydroxy-2-naphthoate octaprenyltransferase